MDLSKIFNPISENLEKFEQEYRNVLETDSKIVRSITDHLSTKEKKMDRKLKVKRQN